MRREPLLRLLSGQKRIESRFSRVHGLPHDRVETGDRIFFKEAAGPVRATARANAVSTWRLSDPQEVESLRSLYNRLILADNDYWTRKRDARWATLIVLNEIYAVAPFDFPKRDRRPWMVLSEEPRYQPLQQL